MCAQTHSSAAGEAHSLRDGVTLGVLLHGSSPSPSLVPLEHRLFAVSDFCLVQHLSSRVGTGVTLLPASGLEVIPSASNLGVFFLYARVLKCPANVWVASCSVAAD